MQKHNIGVMCPGVFSVESILVPSEHKKYCVTISHHEWTGMHYVTTDPVGCKNRTLV
jgi:hypothetical protein